MLYFVIQVIQLNALRKTEATLKQELQSKIKEFEQDKQKLMNESKKVKWKTNRIRKKQQNFDFYRIRIFYEISLMLLNNKKEKEIQAVKNRSNINII